MSGRSHSEETRAKMSSAKNGLYAGEKNPMFGKKHSDITIAKMSSAIAGEKHPMFGKSRPEGAGRPYQKIEREALVIDIKNNITTIYDSISAAALALNIAKPSISKYFSINQKSPFRGRYIFKKSKS